MRLNKYLAQNLQISRRNADEKIAAGHVKINNEIASVGTIVNEQDVVEIENQEVSTSTTNFINLRDISVRMKNKVIHQ